MTPLRLLAFASVLALATSVNAASRTAPPPKAAPKFQADLAHGQELYEECKGCHALPDNLVGPRHCGVVGRKAGSVPDYLYSDVMKNSGITWTDEKLDAFLTSPITYLSGTNMGYAGLFDPKERADLIGYLHQVSEDPACAAISPESKGLH